MVFTNSFSPPEEQQHLGFSKPVGYAKPVVVYRF
jgi:hypothetical protein